MPICGAAPTRQFTTRVLSYNLLYGAGAERRFDSALPAYMIGTNRVPALVAFAKNANPDIWGIQEANGWELGTPPLIQTVAQRLGMRSALVRTPSGFNVGLLTRYEIVEALDLTPQVGRQGVLRAVLRVPNGGLLTVLVAHLDPASDTTRACEIESLLHVLQTYASPRTIMMGDLNFIGGTRASQLLEQAGWQQVAVESNWGLDQIWLSPLVEWSTTPWFAALTVPPNLSDHLPIGAEIALDVSSPITRASAASPAVTSTLTRPAHPMPTSAPTRIEPGLASPTPPPDVTSTRVISVTGTPAGVPSAASAPSIAVTPSRPVTATGTRMTPTGTPAVAANRSTAAAVSPTPGNHGLISPTAPASPTHRLPTPIATTLFAVALPASSPAVTATLPISISETFQGLRVLQTNDFANACRAARWASDWKTSGIANGELQISGQAPWQAHVNRYRNLYPGQGIALRARFAPGTEFEASLDNQAWDPERYLRFGVNLRADAAQAVTWKGTAIQGANLAGNLYPKPGIWYMLILALDRQGNYYLHMTDPAAPGQQLEYRGQVDGFIPDSAWTFGIAADKGQVAISGETEFAFEEIARPK